MSKTSEVPRTTVPYTIDPAHPIGADVEDEKNTQTLSAPPLAQGMHPDDAEIIQGLSQAAGEAHREREEEERKQAEERANSDERPKPSELLAEREGRQGKDDKGKSKKKD